MLRIRRGLYLCVSGCTVVSSGGLLCRPTWICLRRTSRVPLLLLRPRCLVRFLGLALDLGSDRLYDLVDNIPDVIGLRALRPSAAICKVMSVPDSRCVWVVTPDDHVSIGFHEILIHDLADEEWPLVALSDLGCLRLEWPKTLFTFMSRYQFDLDQMHKEWRERFGSTQSGKCTTCGKHIQMNLGKHVALYHMELAQLWRCPVSLCTVWKGTAQDCVDHTRRAHDIPPLVKAANLAGWFTPWTVTREQWQSMSRPAISGIAVDTLLFSRIGVPLFHLYRVCDRQGTHGAFRGTYMRRIHTFLEESDAASLRRRHRRCAWDIAAWMSQTSTRRREDKSPDVSSRSMVFRRSVSRSRGSTKSEAAAAAYSSKGAGMVRSHRSEGDTIQALMELALPRFGGLGNRSAPVHKSWMVSTDSPASPDPACPTDLARSQSPCLNLDTLSLDDAEESVIPRNISVTVLCGSEDGHILVSSDQVLLDVDLPAASDSRDRRQVLQTQELSPVDWFFRRTVSMGHPENVPDGQQQHSSCVQDSGPAVRSRADKPGLSVAGPSPVVGSVVRPVVGQVETVHLSSPPMSGQLSPGSRDSDDCFFGEVDTTHTD